MASQITQLLVTYYNLRNCEAVAQGSAGDICKDDRFDQVDTVPSEGESQRAMILRVSRELIQLADEFERNYAIENGATLQDSSTESSKQDSPVEDSEGQEQGRLSFVSGVIKRFSGCLSRETFQSALLSMSEYTSSLPLEFALTLELASELMENNKTEGPLTYIPQAIAECFQTRITIEELQNMMRNQPPS